MRKRNIPLKEKLGNVGDLVIAQTIAGRKVYRFISIAELKTLLGI